MMLDTWILSYVGQIALGDNANFNNFLGDRGDR